MLHPSRPRVRRCGCATCQRHPYSLIAQGHRAINRVLVTLDEKNRRLFAGLLAIQWGEQSISLLSRITGLSRTTIHRGKREIEHSDSKKHGRIRAPGAGRLPVEINNPASWRH